MVILKGFNTILDEIVNTPLSIRIIMSLFSIVPLMRRVIGSCIVALMNNACKQMWGVAGSKLWKNGSSYCYYSIAEPVMNGHHYYYLGKLEGKIYSYICPDEQIFLICITSSFFPSFLYFRWCYFLQECYLLVSTAVDGFWGSW